MGTMIPASGPSETFSCVVTYFPADAGASLRQNLRCKSPNYLFEGATQLKIAAGKVTGLWQDKFNSLHGTVSGTITSDGFLIFLSGELFDDSCQFRVPAGFYDRSRTDRHEEIVGDEKVSDAALRTNPFDGHV
jgi:hypothetical protein